MYEGYSIRDDKSGVYTPPFFVKHTIEAVRSVQQAANDPQSNLAMYPEDFSLWRVCEFQEMEGEVTTLDAPVKILGIYTLVKKEQKNESHNP